MLLLSFSRAVTKNGKKKKKKTLPNAAIKNECSSYREEWSKMKGGRERINRDESINHMLITLRRDEKVCH